MGETDCDHRQKETEGLWMHLNQASLGIFSLFCCSLQPINVAFSISFGCRKGTKGLIGSSLHWSMKRPPWYKISIGKFHKWLCSCINIWWSYQGTMRNSSFSLEQSVTCSCPTIVTPLAGSELCRASTHGGFTCECGGDQLSRRQCKYCGFFFSLLRSHIQNPLKLLHNSSNGSPQGRHQ